MRLHIVLAILLVAAAAQAKEPKHFQTGKLLKMESVKCGTDAKNAKSFAGEMIGTDSDHMKTRELLCQQYVLETDTVLYTIQPKDDKHPELLPMEDLDDKEHEYFVVSMSPNDAAAHTPSESSHLSKTNTW